VATNAGILEVVITATTSGLTAGIANARDAINKAGPDFKRYGALLFGSVVVGLTASVHAFGEAEKNATLLSQALANQGIHSREALEELLKLSTELQHLSGISDDAIQNAEKIIVTFGATGKELERMTRAAVDAAAQGKDLEGAAEALGKAYLGETGRLKQYGITIDEAVPKALRFAEALRQWEKLYGGSAAAKGKTFFGMIGIAKEDIEDFGEEIGRNLVPTVKRFVQFMIDNRDVLMKASADIGRGILKWADDFATVFTYFKTKYAQLKAFMASSPNLFFGKTTPEQKKLWDDFSDPGNSPTHVDTKPATLVPAGMSAGAKDDDKKGKGSPSEFSELWKQAYSEIFADGKIVFDGIKDLISGTIGVLSQTFQQVFINLAEGGKNFTQIMSNLGTSFRNLMFKVIADILAKQITAILMSVTAERAAALAKVAFHKAVAFAGALAAHAPIPFVGVALGLAAAAAIAAYLAGAIQFAEGGIVNGPTLGLVGEAGPEAIIPLKKGKEMGIFGGGGGGGTTEVHLHFDGAALVDGDETKWDNIARRHIIPALAAYQDKTRANDFRRWPTRG